MVSAARRTRLILTSGIIAVILAALTLAACSAPAHPDAPASTTRAASTRPASSPTAPAASPSPSAAPVGAADSYQVGEQQMTFTEPARRGPTGQSLEPRTLVTTIDYPLAPGSAAGSATQRPASGPHPLLLFAPGFAQCVETYGDLLRTWASAGYVVAAVTFPNTKCQLGTADEQDLVNQPGDMSYVLSSLLTLNGQPHGLLSGLLNSQQIAAAGQSDGGDTVAALVANTCCTDDRVKAAAVLSGAEWPPMPGQYFAHATPPMLFVQGNADTINPPAASVRLYTADVMGTHYYLNLPGAGHMTPYSGANPVEAIVARVTLAFFDRYLLGQSGARAAMIQAGNVGGAASLVSGGHIPRYAG